MPSRFKINNNFSDYIIYADESGDHNLQKIDQNYPIFSLALCVIKKSDYINNIVPAMQSLKFKYFGHDKVVFHEREIRKQQDDFAILRSDEKLRESFLNDINNLVKRSNFIVTSCVIKKNAIKDDNSIDELTNPYHLALNSCMKNLLFILLEKGQKNKEVACIFEKRGRKKIKS